MAIARIICFLIVGIVAFEGTSSVKADPSYQYKLSPMERGTKFQGDIVLTTEQKEAILALNSNKQPSPLSKTGLLSTLRRWPKSQGNVWVPIFINDTSKFSEDDKKVIWKDLKVIEGATCVRFVHRTSQKDYVEIINSRGCWSYIGRVGGRQQLSLQKGGCVYPGIIVHEFNHVLGYDHMQNRDDRDKYVDIRWKNVELSMASNFDKVGSAFGNFNTSYEYMSVMHYSKSAFSKNGLDTIVTRDKSFLNKIGSKIFTAGDATRINNMYKCK